MLREVRGRGKGKGRDGEIKRVGGREGGREEREGGGGESCALFPSSFHFPVPHLPDLSPFPNCDL